MAEIVIKRGELVAPGPIVPNLSTSAAHKIIISWFRRAQLIEFEDALFRTDSAVVMPSAEGPSAEDGSGRRRTMVGIAAAVLRHCEEHPERTLLVAGHADTTGRCESTAFNPWHALPAHRPLGNMNRARKQIYEAMAAFRAKRAGAAPGPGTR